MITEGDVKKLSELARIDLSEKEEENLARDLESILGYFGKLKEVSVGDLSERVLSERLESNLRKDAAPSGFYAESGDLVGAAPEAENGFIKVKPVFDRT